MLLTTPSTKNCFALLCTRLKAQHHIKNIILSVTMLCSVVFCVDISNVKVTGHFSLTWSDQGIIAYSISTQPKSVMSWCCTHQLLHAYLKGIICIAGGKNRKRNYLWLKTIQRITVVVILLWSTLLDNLPVKGSILHEFFITKYQNFSKFQIFYLFKISVFIIFDVRIQFGSFIGFLNYLVAY